MRGWLTRYWWMRKANRQFGAGIFFLGAVGVLEWFKVIGDGGPLIQLALSVVGVVAGLYLFIRFFNPHRE